ncbi:MAG: rRNA pseudouridine synthase [Planctomycetes bacterium]|nr:rRNA pseudouridine synthase [Planctomycetota bacterium]
MEERLHKVMAHAGIASRRKCEDLIRQGLVKVNNTIVREVGVKVDPSRDTIYYQGRPIKTESKCYFLVHKPKGYICSNKDERGRRTIMNLFKNIPYRLYTVGRLDSDSEGLVIVTNDGDLCNMMIHPRYEVPKTYHIVVRGALPLDVAEKIQKGVWLSEGKTAPAKMKIIKKMPNLTVLEMTITEGKKREIRRVFAKFGYPVKSLTRISIGKLQLRGLHSGAVKPVSKEFIISGIKPEGLYNNKQK